ncbi:MAG: hypothetical protein P8J50_05295 [Acidimicrobiales bacterium]|nr:hypothetical protein [Acidimicrobiales bacterium]
MGPRRGPAVDHGTTDLRTPDGLSDGELIETVSRALTVDRTVDNSFVLHFPLELLARADLLDRVSPSARSRVRERLVSLATLHGSSGDPVPLPDPVEEADVDRLTRDLVGAIGAGDADTADAVAMTLMPRLPVDELCRRLVPPREQLARPTQYIWAGVDHGHVDRAEPSRDTREDVAREHIGDELRDEAVDGQEAEQLGDDDHEREHAEDVHEHADRPVPACEECPPDRSDAHVRAAERREQKHYADQEAEHVLGHSSGIRSWLPRRWRHRKSRRTHRDGSLIRA